MNYKNQLSGIKSSTVIKGITKDSINYLLFNIFQETKFKFIVHIVKDNFELELSKKEIEFYNRDIEVIKFPEWNTIPYDVNSPQLKIQTERMEAIYKLLNFDELYKNKKVIFLISRNAAIQKIINKKDFIFIKLFVGQEISANEMDELLKNNCYESNETSINLGDYSINNNVVDLITFDNQCYRIILKNNRIETIKSFNPDTQIGFNSYDSILVLPMKEVIFNENNIQNFKQNYRNSFGIPKDDDYLYQNISKKILYNGCENWLPLFYDNELETIFDYLPKHSVISYNSNIDGKIEKYVEQIKNYYNLRILELECKENKIIYNPIKSNLLYIDNNELKDILKKYTNIIFDIDNLTSDAQEINLNIKNIPDFYKESKEVFKSLKEYLN